MADLRVEEDLRPQEALVAHINGELLLADGIDAGVLLDPLGTVRVVFVELFHQIWAHVAEALLQEDGCTVTSITKPRILTKGQNWHEDTKTFLKDLKSD